jgi:hypothetical protein
MPSAWSSQHQGDRLAGGRQADILLVPDLEAGNMLAKQLIYLAQADAAGLVLGARVPIILTSRADSLRVRLASSALARLFASRSRWRHRQGGRMNRWLLTFNAGSSSIKLGVFRLDGSPRQQDRPGAAGPAPAAAAAPGDRGRSSEMGIDADPAASMDKVLEQVLHQLEVGHEQGALCAVGHRVVHGGLHLAHRCCWTPPEARWKHWPRWRPASAAEPAPDPRHRAVASRPAADRHLRYRLPRQPGCTGAPLRPAAQAA